MSLIRASGDVKCQLSEFYGPTDDKESIATIHRAIELGSTFLDTADMYGVGRNEELVGQAIRDRRDQMFLATKFGNVRGADGSFLGVNGRPEYGPSDSRVERIAQFRHPYSIMEGVKTAIERVRTKATIPQLSAYSFRHKAATILRRARVPEDQIAVQLGHHRPRLGSLLDAILHQRERTTAFLRVPATY